MQADVATTANGSGGASLNPFSRYLTLAGVLLIAAVLIGLGMWRLPAFFVSEEALLKADGSRDPAAVQAAYNSARVPIGVVLAALVAAASAGAGVIATLQSLSVTRDGLTSTEARHRLDLEQAKVEDAEDRKQWRLEQYSQRFQDAARQLGDVAAPVRLAGAYAMARLADDWQDQRQVCVNVLCSYLRLPEPSDKELASERPVRETIQSLLRTNLLDRRDGRGPKWPELTVDLSNAALHNFDFRDFSVHHLSLRGAVLTGFCHVSGKSRVACDLTDVRVAGDVELAGTDVFWESMQNIIIESGRSVWWVSPPSDPRDVLEVETLRILEGELQLQLEELRDGGVFRIGTLVMEPFGTLIAASQRTSKDSFEGGLVIVDDDEAGGRFVIKGDLGNGLRNALPAGLLQRAEMMGLRDEH